MSSKKPLMDYNRRLKKRVEELKKGNDSLVKQLHITREALKKVTQLAEKIKPKPKTKWEKYKFVVGFVLGLVSSLIILSFKLTFGV